VRSAVLQLAIASFVIGGFVALLVLSASLPVARETRF